MTLSKLPKMTFPYDRMRLTPIHSRDDLGNPVLDSPIIRQVLGGPFRLPGGLTTRPFLYNSVVMSIDGKIAFDDQPQGPMIATRNAYGTEDATIDWWILNLLRASSDAIIFGANTLNREPTATGHVHDEHLEQLRVDSGKLAVPLNIIPTLDGMDIPTHHIEFQSSDIPVLFYTVNSAIPVLKALFPSLTVFGPFASIEAMEVSYSIIKPGDPCALISSMDSKPNPHILLGFLKRMGIERVLVESPFLTHLFMQRQLMDALFINVSCLYVGGNAMSIGKLGDAFTSQNHPHTRLQSLALHSDHFLFTRQEVLKEGNL